MEISVENIIFLIPIYYVFKFDAKRGALFLNSEVRIEKKTREILTWSEENEKHTQRVLAAYSNVLGLELSISNFYRQQRKKKTLSTCRYYDFSLHVDRTTW